MCGEMSVRHTEKECMESREALDILQGTGHTPPQRPTFPRRSIVLRLRNPQLKPGDPAVWLCLAQQKE